ncbi:hypothetical protein RBH26_11700 [Natronolimnohabitans sp. A-GB9]|uniref:hypothetical protein n=1 Tax=Natronolimnohabitans sp. A-GB9 TaxID=3069757 RepID=UPI0027B23E98|nr:hypothetical protein [Natronolimnohabitans sp. A-GB9]MDQ2051145.1 hypothetical protein [Natronolimnohabitans sp. A-GB9]
MRLSIPGLPGVYYDTDSGTTAIGVATTAIGRKAPKPKGYAIQLLPYLWSFDVDLHEVPNDHPIQYLHPEGAQSLGELSPEQNVRRAGTELESVLRFVWSINQEVESTTNQLLGRSQSDDGVVIEIEAGTVSVDGEQLATDEFDFEEPSPDPAERADTEIEIDDGTDVIDETESDSEVDADDVFGATEETPVDDEFDSDEEFGVDDTDDIDPDET